MMRTWMVDMKRGASRVLAMLLVLAICLTAGAVGVSAADGFSGSGKGTSKNPYLVTNAQQVLEMANDLSAHYKLANTIDMTGVDFTPIGYLAQPFTGSFTCDLGEDGAPLYAIKNLTYHNAAGEKNGHVFEDSRYPDYKKNESHWEAAFFGATSGATISNIYILDAKISNSVVGQHQQNGNGSWNPGMDENASAILVAFATRTNISGCFVTGSVDCKTNWSGALVGAATGCIIKNSSAQATVKARGYWNNGGLIGGLKDGTIVDSCSFAGDVTASGYNMGGFIGSCSKDCKVTNCWAAGTISSGNSFITNELKNDGLKKVVENNYSLVKVATRKNASTSKTTVNNCWITDEVGGMQMFFGAASNAELLEKFQGLDAWITEGVETPQLKATPVVRTADSYVVGAVVEPSTDPEPTQPGIAKPDDSQGSNQINVTNNGNDAETVLIRMLIIIIAVLVLTTVIIQVLNILYIAKKKKGGE